MADQWKCQVCHGTEEHTHTEQELAAWRVACRTSPVELIPDHYETDADHDADVEPEAGRARAIYVEGCPNCPQRFVVEYLEARKDAATGAVDIARIREPVGDQTNWAERMVRELSR